MIIEKVNENNLHLVPLRDGKTASCCFECGTRDNLYRIELGEELYIFNKNNERVYPTHSIILLCGECYKKFKSGMR